MTFYIYVPLQHSLLEYHDSGSIWSRRSIFRTAKETVWDLPYLFSMFHCHSFNNALEVTKWREAQCVPPETITKVLKVNCTSKYHNCLSSHLYRMTVCLQSLDHTHNTTQLSKSTTSIFRLNWSISDFSWLEIHLFHYRSAKTSF